MTGLRARLVGVASLARADALTTGLFVLAALGLGARVALTFASIGSSDSIFWMGHGKLVAAGGVAHAYADSPPWALYNHPPLPGYWAAAAYRISGDNAVVFSRLLKLPALLGEVGSCALLSRLWTRRRGSRAGALAATLYAWALCPILVSAYHGNTDALEAFLCLLSVYYLDVVDAPFRGGLALAAALNVKLMPLLIVGPLALQCRTRREFLRFSFGLALAIVPFVPFLIVNASNTLHNMLGYNSSADNWGVFAFLRASSGTRFAPSAHFLEELYRAWGRYVVLGAIVAFGAVGRVLRRWDRFELAAGSIVLFLILTPGFGVQYTILAAPMLFATSLKRGAIYSLLAGLFIGAIYLCFLDPSFPWRSSFKTAFPPPTPLIGVLVWGWLVSWFITLVQSRILSSKHAGLPGMTAAARSLPSCEQPLPP